jgi:membrane-associated phospholipid phosphatase
MRMTGIKLRLAAAWGLAAAALASPAAAQSLPLRFDPRLVPSGAVVSVLAGTAQAPVPRFNTPFLPAGGVLAGTAVVALAPSLFPSLFKTATCAPCDPSGLNFLDRGSVGQVRFGAATVSNALLYASVGGSGLLLFADAHGNGSVAREDLTVLAQSIATASVITSWLKVLTHRPRPFRYVPAETTITFQSGISFPSGHSTASWAAAFSYWSIQQMRGRAGQHALGIGALMATAATCGVMRVVARQHFPTDVMAGALIGAAVGWFVPRIYPVRRSP